MGFELVSFFVLYCSNSIKEEIKSLKRQLVKGKDNDKDDAKKMKPSEESLANEEEEGNDILKDFHLQQKKYAQQKISKKKTGGHTL